MLRECIRVVCAENEIFKCPVSLIMCYGASRLVPVRVVVQCPAAAGRLC